MARTLAGEGPDGLLRLPLLYGLTAERRGLGHEACAALLLEAGLRLEREWFGRLAASEDMHEGLQAFVDKRPADFQGR